MTDKEKETYECYLDRISAPAHPVPLPKEECDKYNKKHPLPSREELDRILKEAGAI